MRDFLFTQRVLEPNDVIASVAGDENIEVPVGVHVDGASVVGALLTADDSFGELALAVIFIPSSDVHRILAAGHRIDVAIVIQIGEVEGMWH